MTLVEAVESLKTSLAQGDDTMQSKSWSGGGFKAEAVRTLLSEAGLWTRLRSVADTGTAQSFLAISDDDKREFFAMAVDDSVRRKRAVELVKRIVDDSWIEHERDNFARIRLDDLAQIQALAGDEI